MRHLTEALRIEILMMIGYGERSRTQAEVAELFQANHPDLPRLSQSTVSKIEKRYREFGSVRDVPRKRAPVVDDNTKLDVLLALQENPITPARQLARDNEISHQTVLKILKTGKMHPYKMQMLQELTDEDPDRRNEFCEQMMDFIDRDQMQLNWILFSDECTFTLHGEVNHHNCRYWSDNNPHWMRETHTQRPQKLNVWAGIIGDQVVGPFFIDNNLDGPSYLSLLRDELVPHLRHQFPTANQNEFDNRIWYQQDGAPAHYALPVRNYLDQIFPNRWIGRRGALEWPPRSPDLNPMDFFLWGYLKNKVYVTPPTNLQDLRDRITLEARNISPEVFRNVRNGFYDRLALCQERIGHHFEHIR